MTISDRPKSQAQSVKIAQAGPRCLGFTLTELLAAISVFGILSALSLPSFREITLNNQRAARINELLTDLNFARTQAVSTNRQVVVCRTATPQAPVCGSGEGWEEGWVIFVDEAAPANADFDAGEEILRRREASAPQPAVPEPAAERFTLRGDSEDELGIASRVVFASSGTSPTAGSIMACDGRDDPRKGRQIVIVAGGRVRSVEPGAGASCLR